MDIETIRDYCLAKKGTTEGFPFGEDFLVFKVITLKCDPDYALELRDHYPGVEGAYHFNKKYWNQVSLKGDIDDKMILHLIDHSYEEVIKKFTRKLKQEYNELPD